MVLILDINWEGIENGFRILIGMQLVIIGLIHILNKKFSNLPLGILLLVASMYFFWKWLIPHLDTTIGRMFLLLNRELFIPPLLYLILLQTQRLLKWKDYLNHLMLPLAYVIICQAIIIPNYDKIDIGLVANSVGMFSCILSLIIYFFLGRKRLKVLKTQLIKKAYNKYKLLFYVIIISYGNMYFQGILSYFIQYRIFLTYHGDKSTGLVYTNTDSVFINSIGWFFNVPFYWYNMLVGYPLLYITPLFLIIFGISELPYFKSFFLPKDIKHSKEILNSGEDLLSKLDAYFKDNKPYKDNNFSVSICSEYLQSSEKDIKDSLKLHRNLSFKDYINLHQINDFKTMLEDDGNSKYDISSLAEICGFNSKATFYRAFKEFEGITPKEYLKRTKK